MKRILKHAALALILILGASAPAALAKNKRRSAAHTAAVKKCKEEYNEAVKAARGKRGNERKEALAAAKKERQSCLAGAPQ